MQITNLPYFIKNALSNIRHSMLVNFVAVSTIAIAILIFSTSVMIIYNLTNIVSKFEGAVHIVAYLKDKYSNNYDNIKEEIMKLPSVEDVRFRSKDDALKSFKSSLGKNDTFLDDIPVNPLPASFEVRLKESDRNKAGIESVAKSLKEMGVFEDTAYGQEWIEHFHNFLDIMKIFSVAIGGLFSLAALFIISNTIKLTIYLRRDEISILRLVGATDSFIKAPFFIEGVIQGVCGGVISIGALYILYRIFLAKVQTLNFIGINSQNMPFLPTKFLLFLIVFSTTLGIIGSFVSLKEVMRE